MKSATKTPLEGEQGNTAPRLTIEQVEGIEKMNIRVDEGSDEPEIYLRAIFIPSVLVSRIEKVMGPFYLSPGEYIAEKIRNQVIFSNFSEGKR